MKSSRKFRNWLAGITVLIVFGIVLFKFLGATNECFPVNKFYDYDKALPLQDSVKVAIDTTTFKTLSISYTSVHDQRVTGLLSLPKNSSTPLPVIILMHGLGDNKTVDYIEYGKDIFLKNGYAVMRIDISDHGDRKKEFYDFDLTGAYKYWSRNIITQTVFDLRRAIDFIETRKELDSKRIGYYGISLGGIIGTIFCGVDERI